MSPKQKWADLSPPTWPCPDARIVVFVRTPIAADSAIVDSGGLDQASMDCGDGVRHGGYTPTSCERPAIRNPAVWILVPSRFDRSFSFCKSRDSLFDLRDRAAVHDVEVSL